MIIDGLPTLRANAGTKDKVASSNATLSTAFSSSYDDLSQLDSSDMTSDASSSSLRSAAGDEETGLLIAQPDQGFSLLEPKISRGNESIPLQSDARPLLKYLIWFPLATVASMVFFSYFWLPLLLDQGVFDYTDSFFHALLKNRFAMLVLIVPLVGGLVWDIGCEIWHFVMLMRGRRRRYLPEEMPRLVHAVIVCNYKEPLEVLRATVASIADNTLAENIMVILACEARDPGADATFEALAAEFQGRLRSFTKTTHVLAPGEIVGKSSNENHACRELYKMVEAEGLDSFQVMVTTCDADSLFDTVFFEQVEAEYCRTPDGRRFIYNSPINTYRNLNECHPIVKAFEVRRCQFDLFTGLTAFRPAQSNYSLTLGFANEIGFWDPSNTSEDFHTTLKAMAMTGKGTEVVVKVWSLILNDSVTGFQDRWVQAKRHMWGIEESAFVLTLFPVLRITAWLSMLGRVSAQMYAPCVPLALWFLFRPVWQVFFSLSKETQYLLLGMFVFGIAYDWIKTFLREVFLYKLIIGDRKLMQKRTMGEWASLFLVWPAIAELSCFIFSTLATWRMLIHAVRHTTLVYVTAPKALTSGVDTSNSSSTFGVPKKSA